MAYLHIGSGEAVRETKKGATLHENSAKKKGRIETASSEFGVGGRTNAPENPSQKLGSTNSF